MLLEQQKPVFVPFSTTPVNRNANAKPFDKMSPHQQRWARSIQQRTQDKNWRLAGKSWDSLKWELHYLAGYTFIPARDIQSTGFERRIEPIRSVGLLVISHFWANNRNNNAAKPEVGIAVRLYRTTYDDATDTVMFGFNGEQKDDAKSSSVLAKNLALMPYSGAIGATFDPDKTPVLLDTALALENYITAAATEEGRALVEEPCFPPCLLGFSANNVPTQQDVDLDVLKGVALRYLSIVGDDGLFRNGEYLSLLRSEVAGEVREVKMDGQMQKLIVGGEEIVLPAVVALRPGVGIGSHIHVGQVLGDFVLPTDMEFGSDPWGALVEVTGDFGADWLLTAAYESNVVEVNEAGERLLCVPHILLPGWGKKATQKFIDLRAELGRDYLDPNDPAKVVKTMEKEARIHVMHLGQAACTEAMQFGGLGFNADLAGVRPYWEKHYKTGRAPRRNANLAA